MLSSISSSSSGQRAFVSRKNRAHASDVRMQVRSGGLVHPCPVSVDADVGSNIQLVLSDVVDAVDVEEILSQRKVSSVYDISSPVSTPRALSEFPPDDLEVRQVQREWATVDPPFDIKSIPVDAHAHAVMECLTDPLSLVNRKLIHLSSGEVLGRILRERSTLNSRHIYDGERDGSRATKSASFVDPETEVSKRSSFVSCASTGTVGSAEGHDGRLQLSVPDQIFPGILERVSVSQMEESNEAKRNEGRHPSLVGLLHPSSEAEIVESRRLPPFPEERSGFRLFLRVSNMRVEPQIEPLFGSLTLYDVVLRRRLSESFHFDLNPSALREMLPCESSIESAVEKCNQAAFALSSPLSDVFIVVKLEKVLQGCEPSEAFDSYVAARDERVKEKLLQSAGYSCSRLGSYRMPLAVMFVDLSRVLLGINSLERGDFSMAASTVTAHSAGDVMSGTAPLASEDAASILSADRISLVTTSTFKRVGSGTSASTVLNRVLNTPLQRRRHFPGGVPGGYEDSAEASALKAPPQQALAALQPVVITLSHFVKVENEKLNDEEIIRQAVEVRRAGRGKSRGFPVDLTLRIWGENADEVDGRLNAQGELLGGISDTTSELSQEVSEIPRDGKYAVNLAYRNVLLLYPRMVNMSGRSATARNISVRIQLMDAQEKPLSVFFHPNTRRPTANCAFTSVIYHNKSPQLNDEVKLLLPPDLKDGHHLLFTFYHISCKPVPREEPVEFPLGYSWLPLLRENRLSTGDWQLPIALERLPSSYGYLSPDIALPNIKWLDGHKPAFSLSLVALSSVHPEDEHVERFLSAFHSLSSHDRDHQPVREAELQRAIHGICKARPEPMVAFLYQILDALFALIANPPYSKTTSAECFSTIGQLVKICSMLLDTSTDNHGRGSILTTYIHYFKIALKESRPRSALCRELARQGTQIASPDSEKIFDIIEDMERSRNVKASPAEPIVFNTNKNLQEELVDLWVTSSGGACENATLNSSFFLELLSKALAEFLSMTGRLFLPRKSRFSDRFLRCLSALSSLLCAEVLSRSLMDVRLAISISNSWAFFIRDALSLMDRSFVFGLIAQYNRCVVNKINTSESLSTSLVLMKLDFLRVVCSHEHFIVLNLPYGGSGSPMATSSTSSSPSNSAATLAAPSGPPTAPASPGASSQSSRDSSFGSLSSELTADYRSRHFLLGLILSDLSAILDTSSHSTIRSRAISLLCSLLACHEVDPRLSEPTVRSRVASLYLPYLTIVMDSALLFFDVDQHRRQSSGVCSRLSYHDADCSPRSVDPGVAMAIAGVGEGVGGMARTLPRAALTLEQTRQMLACLCWVVRSLDRAALRSWLRELSPGRFVALIDILRLAVSAFEFSSSSLEDLLDEGARDAADLDDTLKAASTTGTLSRRKEVTTGVRWRDTAVISRCAREVEGLLCAEVTLCIVDVLETASRVVSSPGCDHLLFTLPLLFKLLLHILSCKQSVVVLEALFATQRAFVVKYPDLVFEQETEECAELCLQLLRHCASRLPSIRSQAAASAYLLMRESYESTSSLARVKMHFTMSLSTLVSNGTRMGSWLNEECLRRSLKTLLTYAQTEFSTTVHSSLQSFCEQVKDLVFNMHMILSNTVRMKEFANYFEMSMDLIYYVAKGYQNNPDLRVTWLLSMASRAAERGCFAEAAQSFIHSAALVSEYLAMLPGGSSLPKGAVDFCSVSENVLEESAVSDDVVSPEREGICESCHFSESGLLHLLEKAFHFLERAQQYEYMPALYQVLEPILVSRREYSLVSHYHKQLGDAVAKIEGAVQIRENTADAWLSPLRSSDKRCFGTYFRVGFYGSKFGEMDGEEFVYKEAAFVKLSEVSSRLESFYSERLGAGVVEVIKDSNMVIRDLLDSSKAYLQITYVEPYLDVWERRRRGTHFKRGNELNRFSFATPFTRDGKAHGDLKDQYKRRTILTTQHSFPYVKTRLRVEGREQKVLSPIEVAIEDVEKKTRELAAAVAQEPPDAKMLQMVLQGCIGTTVNQGPLEVANVFLGTVSVDEVGKPVDRLQNKLRLCFRDFSKKCADALILNKSLIHSDQLAYQNELQKNYADFTKKMAPMIGGGSGRAAAGLSRLASGGERGTTLSSSLAPSSLV